MSIVFLDTVGLIATWDEADQWHGDADRAFVKLIADRSHLVTTRYVLLECGNAAARRPYRNRVSVLRQKMEERGDLAVPTDDDWKIAWNEYETGSAAQAGIVDQVSFAVMRRLGIKDAFTNDRHFQAAGFSVLF